MNTIKQEMKKLVATLLLAGFLFGTCRSQTKELEPGDPVPSFSLTDQDGHLFNSSDYTGKKILVIYFYPKDESMVCTREACAFRDSFADFTRAGALVIGINAGSVESHKAFQQHHHLPFILLSDPDNKVLKQFGVKGFIFSGRETFVVDLSGRIAYSYNSFMEGRQHALQALQFIREPPAP
jgi:thioredoxin-dependent peroxiredoxin